MLLKNDDPRKLEGNLQGKTYKVGISDMRLIIDRLTDMYSDRQMAVIREYSCNARDAHIEAGVTAPIDVTTPGPMAQFLTIRDYGVGLTESDIEEIYSQYGASTKRQSNDQTGAFGLGCKSALAYSDQFTVTSVKDGVRIQVVVSRDPKEGVTMKVVDTSTTTDANGTTVMIPCRAGNEMDRKAREFFKYWEKGTVRINGVEPEYMPNVKWVTDTICINEARGYGGSQSVIVMGGVPYPAVLNHGLGYSESITAFVPIGSVTPMPARETLGDDDDTMGTIRQINADFQAGLEKSVRKDIESAGSPGEAARKRLEWKNKLGARMPRDVKYKGNDVPDAYKVEDTLLFVRFFRGYSSKMSEHTSYRKDAYLPLPSVSGSLWVTGFDYASFTATVRKKLDKYVEDNSLQITNYVLTETQTKPSSIWLENITYIDWPTIKAIKLPRAAKQATLSGRIPGSYDTYENGDWNEGVPGDDIDTGHSIFWMFGTTYWQGRDTANWLNESYPKGYTLVMLRRGREDKFKKLFPQAQYAPETIKAAYDQWKKGLDKKDVTAYWHRQNLDGRLKSLDLTKVDDPQIKSTLAVVHRDTTKLEDEIAFWAKQGFYWEPDASDKVALGNPLDRYPLLPEYYYFDRHMKRLSEHIYRYMNAEFLYQTQKSAQVKP